MPNKVNKTTRVVRDQKMIDGTKKHLSGVSITVAGKAVTEKDAVAVLQARVDATSAVQAARAAFRKAVADERAEVAQTKAFVSSFRRAVAIAFEGALDSLSDFGIDPPKQRKRPDVQQAAETVAKAKATRAQRGTMGPKKRLKVKGTVIETAPVTQVPPPKQPA